MSGAVYRFGGFTFDAGSGELRSADAAEPERLQPQPARLLGLLLAKRGDLLSREEIRAGIWPDVAVDFDRSLHFCVRQVRAALGDTATEPRYVETLPRRGYRLIPPVERLDPAPAGRARPRRAWGAAAIALLLLGAATALVVGFRASPGGRDGRRGDLATVEPPLRIGVMPFAPPEGGGFAGAAAIAEWVLEDLTPRAGGRAEVVGPTTTARYDGAVRELAADYDLDYVINGRFLLDGESPRLLAELIRVSDGAHVWVRAYKDVQAAREIGREISASTLRELALEE